MEKGFKADAQPKIALLYIKHTAVLWFDFAGLQLYVLEAQNIVYCKDINVKANRNFPMQWLIKQKRFTAALPS